MKTVEIDLTTQEDAEETEYVVCIPTTDPLKFADNLTGPCCKCGQIVQFRPHSPKKPPRICFECVQPIILAQAAKDELGIVITPTTAAEVSEILAKKAMH